ncbi:hypothetical protein BGW39_001235 [Mortierella sp. 14UC]|nr:hypothetical protein BGW39_001235 [Mortierella sp. 14UC]
MGWIEWIVGQGFEDDCKSVEILEVCDVVGFKESDLVMQVLEPLKRREKPMVCSNSSSTGTGTVATAAAGGLLVLSNVTTLEVTCFPQNTDLVYLSGCCPNLEQFDMNMSVLRFEFGRLANTLKTLCPKLTTLRIEDDSEDDDRIRHGLLYGPPISNCSTSGLTKILLSTLANENLSKIETFSDPFCPILRPWKAC